MIIKNLDNYKFSTDYYKLYDLAKKQSIICEVDYHNCRDIAQTIYTEYDDYLSVSARGISYISSFSKEEFISACEHLNLKWLEYT
jgi:hypothetical protein